jgi:predicted acylesterase/phospholipase RssA
VLLRCYKRESVDKKFYVSSTANDIMRDNQDKVTISLAARATSAAPTFFPEVTFPEQKSGEVELNVKKTLKFWDGGLLNNNPIDQLWYARYEIVHPEDPPPAISCVISLGTGWVRAASPSDSTIQLFGVASGVMDFATNTNAKGKDFSRHMEQLKQRSEHKKSRYFRFQPRLGTAEIGLADYTRMEELKVLARAYAKADMQVEQAVCALCCSGCKICVEE